MGSFCVADAVRDVLDVIFYLWIAIGTLSDSAVGHRYIRVMAIDSLCRTLDIRVRLFLHIGLAPHQWRNLGLSDSSAQLLLVIRHHIWCAPRAPLYLNDMPVVERESCVFVSDDVR